MSDTERAAAYILVGTIFYALTGYAWLIPLMFTVAGFALLRQLYSERL